MWLSIGLGIIVLIIVVIYFSVHTPNRSVTKSSPWKQRETDTRWHIATAVVNNPTFVEMQFKTLQRFFKSPFRFIVFNDAKAFPDSTNGGDVTIKKRIRDVCESLGIECIDIPNDHHKHNGSISMRHTESMRHIMKFIHENHARYILLDSDMFLVSPLDPEEYFQDHIAAVIPQNRVLDGVHVTYIWPGLCFLDVPRIPDIGELCFDLEVGLDSGGRSRLWYDLQKQKGTPVMTLTHKSSLGWTINDMPRQLDYLRDFFISDPRNQKGKMFCEIYADVFLHYRAGSNWVGEGMDLHHEITEMLRRYLIGQHEPESRKGLIVIAAHNDPQYLQRLLTSLQEYNVKDAICIVDTGSDDTRMTTFLRDVETAYPNLNFTKPLTTEQTYDTGAYVAAYRQYKFSDYLFLQDTIECTDVDPMSAFRAFDKFSDVVALGSFEGADFDMHASLRPLMNRILHHTDVSKYKSYGIFGPVFYTSWKVMNVLESTGYLNPEHMPRSKDESCAYERIWSMLFQEQGFKIASLTSFDQLRNMRPLQKKFGVGRT